MWTSKLTGQQYVFEGMVGELYSFCVDTGDAAFRLTADECIEAFGCLPDPNDVAENSVTEMAI